MNTQLTIPCESGHGEVDIEKIGRRVVISTVNYIGHIDINLTPEKARLMALELMKLADRIEGR